MTSPTTRADFTLSVPSRPHPVTMTGTYYFAKGSALALAKATGHPVRLSWQDSETIREETIEVPRR